MDVWLACAIEISGKRMQRCVSISVTQSRKDIGTKATIEMPSKVVLTKNGRFEAAAETLKLFKTGDEVKISMGYNGEMREEFRGYIRSIKPGQTVKLECEDAMYLLRRRNLKASFQNTNLKALLDYILKGTDIQLIGEVPVVKFNVFYFRNVTAASALQELLKEYGLTIYFEAWKQLRVGIAYSYNKTKRTTIYEIGKNIIDFDSLEWVDEDDTRIKIKAILMKSNNTKIEKEYGDSDGETRTIHIYNLAEGESMETRAKEELKRVKYTGYKGHITTFLIPNISVGNVMQIRDTRYEDKRNGNYIVEEVETTFGTDGARRKIKPGLKVS